MSAETRDGGKEIEGGSVPLFAEAESETHVVCRENRSCEDVDDESLADVGGVSEAGVLGAVVGLDESRDVEDEASSVGLLKATKGIGRFVVGSEGEAGWPLCEAIAYPLSWSKNGK